MNFTDYLNKRDFLVNQIDKLGNELDGLDIDMPVNVRPAHINDMKSGEFVWSHGRQYLIATSIIFL